MNVDVNYVSVTYKTGTYIAKIVETSPPRTLVEIAAVVEHPLQGDLHHPFEPDVPLFHERRAAANREKVWVPSAFVERYEGEVPEYDESLRRAWGELARSTARMIETSEDPRTGMRRPGIAEWAEKAMAHLRQLHKDYWG